MKKQCILLVVGLILCVALAFGIESFLPNTGTIDLKNVQGIVMDGEKDQSAVYMLEGYDSFDEFAEEVEYPSIHFKSPGSFSGILLEAVSEDECEITFSDGEKEETFYLEYGQTQIKMEAASEKTDISFTFSNPFMEIKKIQMDLNGGMNMYRILFMSLSFACVLTLFVFKKQIGQRIEWGFLIAASACVLMIACLAPMNSAMWWDGDIHYTSTEKTSLIPATLLSENGFTQVAQSLDVSTPSYMVQGMAMFLGRILPLNDWGEMFFHRLFISAFYVTVCYFAIRLSGGYKRALTAIALLPLPLFTAVAYSYDSSIHALVFFGSSLLIDELSHPKRRLTFVRAALITFSLSLVCMPKTLYMPILLLAVLMPSSKFSSKKQARNYRLGIIAACLALVAMYLAPFLLNQETFNDHRANNTSGSEQLAVILSDVPGYMAMIFNCFRNFISNIMLMAGRTTWAYFGVASNAVSMLSLGLMMFAFITEDQGQPLEEKITFKQKVFFVGACVLSIIIIYTSLYISFTEVGAQVVDGVQGRYFLPLFPLLAAIINPRHIRNRMDPVKLNVGLCLISALIVFIMAYQLLLVPYYL